MGTLAQEAGPGDPGACIAVRVTAHLQEARSQQAAYHNPKTKKALRGAMPKLRIKGLERELEAEPDEDVRKACIRSHVNLFWSPWARVFNCRGVGLCGACPVRVLEAGGKLPPRSKKEQKRLSKWPEDWRLACQLKVRSDLVLEPFPRRAVEEVVGEEAVRRAHMEEAERKDLFERERKERLETRRAQVEKTLAEQKKRRSKLIGFFTRRISKIKEKGEEDGKPGKGKDKGKDKEGKAGGLAGRLKRRQKEEDKAGAGKGKEKVAETGGQKAKKKGFKLGKGRDKKKEKPAAPEKES